MDWPAKLGIAMAVVGLIVILIELALIAPRAFRLNTQLGVLFAAIEQTRSAVEASFSELDATGQETHLLWKPYRRILRWLANPLTIALFESYRRRRARSGTDRQGNQASSGATAVDRVAG